MLPISGTMRCSGARNGRVSPLNSGASGACGLTQLITTCTMIRPMLSWMAARARSMQPIEAITSRSLPASI